MLTWPRQIPIEGEPPDVVQVVSDYGEWLKGGAVPKLFVNAEPGSIHVGRAREFCRTWGNQEEITVRGLHFVQEDSPHEIGEACAAFFRQTPRRVSAVSDVVLKDIGDGIATVTMNRPEALNALNSAMTDGLCDAILPLEHDPEVRCVVIQGGEHFMAGGDIKWFAQSVGRPESEIRVEFENLIHKVHSLIIAIRRMPKPVITSVNGAAAGFGLSFALAGDLSIAAG